MSRPQDPDFDWQAAVCLAFGMTHDKAAEYLSVTRETLTRHKTKAKDLYDKRIAFVRGVKENSLTGLAIARGADAEDRIKGLFDRSFRLTEKAISKAEEKGDELTLKELIQIHKEFTVWSSNFAASQAPKRMEVNSRSISAIVQIVGLDEAQNVLRAMREIGDSQPKALIVEGQPVIDIAPDA